MRTQRRTIGRLAREAGVGIETIRFYERRGLLKRPPRPTEGGYRHYDDEIVRLLRYIRLAQHLGLSLNEIEQLLVRSREAQGTFCRAVRQTIEGKLAAVRTELAALHIQEAELQAFLTSCASRSSDLPCPILVGLAHPAQRDESQRRESR